MSRARLKGEPEAEVAYYHCVSRVVERRFVRDGYDKRVKWGFLPIGWPQVMVNK